MVPSAFLLSAHLEEKIARSGVELELDAERVQDVAREERQPAHQERGWGWWWWGGWRGFAFIWVRRRVKRMDWGLSLFGTKKVSNDTGSLVTKILTENNRQSLCSFSFFPLVVFSSFLLWLLFLRLDPLQLRLLVDFLFKIIPCGDILVHFKGLQKIFFTHERVFSSRTCMFERFWIIEKGEIAKCGAFVVGTQRIWGFAGPRVRTRPEFHFWGW